MIRYYICDLLDAPEAIECPASGWPNEDAAGRVQFENTHYDTELDAWNELADRAEGLMRQAVRFVESRRADLAAAEKDLLDATLRRERVRRRKATWEDARGWEARNG